MATIEDVAKLAGLSRTTVSRVINDQPYVTDEKRQRIIQAMDDLGYVPNSSARRLRSQKTETIAVLLPRLTNPFFGNLIEAMEEKASEWGYQVIVCQTHDSKKKEMDYLQLLKTKQVDGVILASLVNDWKDVEPFLESGPIVFCNEYMDKACIPMVHMDHKQAAYDATIHLLEQDCRQICYVTGGPESHLSRKRKEGFIKALNEFGLHFEENLSIDWAINVSDGQKVFHMINNELPHVDGVFTGSDEVAAGLIYEAASSDWVIPEDLAVVGFDNQMVSLLMVPSVTTVEQPVKQMADKTVEVLIQQLLHPGALAPNRYVYPHQLLVRNSTKRKKLSIQ
ncbi:DNA-binding transcriptional regulator, LacI/PurR family [Halobacillus karajensis]|uniref:Degradation activator n=1 Tax=Halobacillus karajensis TaxID=195088 RepID=A0A024P7D1_9BACI|nr:LacI family DNA-binding transcriptional regulator [Halobacillus karajensis]CDQ21091.1 Degradation activator [Halobacillus karajensis]CDQ24845.1 Degradation activator [Halobacillus karajensis]CDQ28795.1 Degradation activator [Halobacillus karajensis]SEH96295.1 DNA-binding transcriptional regulator, LacI/PurR family [Halobacillus karajensis]